MKKLLTVILVLTLGVSLASCGIGGSSENPSAPDRIPTLVWWLCGGEPEDLAEGLEKINAYLVEKINLRISIKSPGWGDWSQKVNMVVNSGEYFDIMFNNDEKYTNFVKLGAFADITGLVQSEAPELWKLIPENVWGGVKVGGKIYSVPTYKDSSMTQYWVFDDKYAQKYGVNTGGGIKTMQDLDKPFRDMKAGEGASFYPLQLYKGDGFNGLFNHYDKLTVGLEPLGVRVDDSTRKVVNILEQEEMKANFRLLHQWFKDGIINPDAATLEEPNKGLPFMSAQGFPGAEALWQVLNGVEKYDMFPVFGPMYSSDTIQGSMNSISANSRYKAEALQFLQLLNTDHKLRDMLAFGVEGKHFQYESANVIRKLTDTWTLPAYQQATFFNMSTQHDAPANQWEQVKKLNDRAVNSVCLGFGVDIEPIKDEVANCKAVWDKYKFELKTGASDPDKAVPACIAELKANGFETILNEVQKQVNAYFS